MMNARRGYNVWLRASLQPGTVFGIAMIAACWIGMTFVTSIERDKVLEGAIQQSDNLVRLFEEYTVQPFRPLSALTKLCFCSARVLRMIPIISTCAIGQHERHLSAT